jgi:WXG100 family type VII secretion target
VSNFNSVNFPAMESDMAGIRSQHTEFQNEMSQLIQQVGRYKDSWTGAARERWDQVEVEWNKSMEVMREKLEQANAYLTQSHQRMTDDESANTRIFN